MGQGAGKSKVIPDGTDDQYDDADDKDGVDQRLKDANHESKTRRLQLRDVRKERDTLRAEVAQLRKQLSDDGQTPNRQTGPDPSEVVLTLVEAGLSRDRIRAAVKLVDWSTVTDIGDAIEELREEHPFLFESSEQKQELPGQGGKGNNSRNRAGGPANEAELMRKYRALRPGNM
jgi:hypothetical protein